MPTDVSGNQELALVLMGIRNTRAGLWSFVGDDKPESLLGSALRVHELCAHSDPRVACGEDL